MHRRMLAGLAAGAALLAGATPVLAAGSPQAGATKTGPVRHHKRSFVAVEAGARLSTTGSRFEDVFRVKKSPFGEGAAIRDAALTTPGFPATGSDIVKTYDRGGRTFAHETFTLAPPNTAGIGAVTGNGTCQSGTGIHTGETCTYTFKGHYSLLTARMFLTLRGTYTLGAHARPAK